jgi:hypothetical protein
MRARKHSSGHDVPRILPELTLSSARYVNLDTIARVAAPVGASPFQNELLDPETCQRMIDSAHAEIGCLWSYGGYLEDRTHLWRLSYLEDSGGFVHLGVDCNVPAGTVVAAPYDCVVRHLFDDGDAPQGWGPRIILEPRDAKLPYLILGHLQPLSWSVGQSIAHGDTISRVAPPPYNGRWFPHLHIQQVSRDHLESLDEEGLCSIDGYGHPSEREVLTERYPDPSWLVTTAA